MQLSCTSTAHQRLQRARAGARGLLEDGLRGLPLPQRERGRACPLSFTYQAVRNVAAAQALAHDSQQPVFGLIYDADNPYFAGCGHWPGAPAALRTTLDPDESPVRFAAVSWQELLPLLPRDAAAAARASEKHGLHWPADGPR